MGGRHGRGLQWWMKVGDLFFALLWAPVFLVTALIGTKPSASVLLGMAIQTFQNKYIRQLCRLYCFRMELWDRILKSYHVKTCISGLDRNYPLCIIDRMVLAKSGEDSAICFCWTFDPFFIASLCWIASVQELIFISEKVMSITWHKLVYDVLIPVSNCYKLHEIMCSQP